MKPAIVIAKMFGIGLSYIGEILQCKVGPTTMVSLDTVSKHIFPFD